jgi:hypothetical protein
METTVALVNEQTKFRDTLRERLQENEQLFWQNMANLKPKDFIDSYIKLLPFAYAKMPDMSIGEDGQQKLLLEETRRRATIIGKGLPVDNIKKEEQ